MSDVELSANFEGNDSLLFYERLKNPDIRERLIDLLLEYENNLGPMQAWEEIDGEAVRMPEKDRPAEIKTREQVAKELDERIEKVFSVTHLDYDPNGTSSFGEKDVVAFKTLNFETGEPWTTKQLSIIEAHEKGHAIRLIHGAHEDLRNRIQATLDVSAIHLSPELKSSWERANGNQESRPDEEVLEEIREYISMPSEIMERMAQLKNYFGMNNDDKFTKSHLDYARKHYAKDTGMGLQMQIFLDAITDETENNFLELINSLGI